MNQIFGAGAVLVAVVMSGNAAAAGLDAKLAPLAPWVGSCWDGKFTNQPGTDTHCFTPMLGGRYVRDVHVVRGGEKPYGGETVYRWDAKADVIRYSYYASDGGYSEGTVIPVEGGLEFPDSYTGPDGKPIVMRTRWMLTADGYANNVERQENGAWRQFWATDFRKAGPAS